MDMDVINAADSADLLGPRGGAKTLNVKIDIDTIFKQHADASEKGAKEGDDTENTAKGIAERMGEAQDDDNSVGRHTGFLGIPYKNLGIQLLVARMTTNRRTVVSEMRTIS